MNTYQFTVTTNIHGKRKPHIDVYVVTADCEGAAWTIFMEELPFMEDYVENISVQELHCRVVKIV